MDDDRRGEGRTYAETNGTEDDHGENVKPGVLEPLTESRPGCHGVGLEAMATSLALLASGVMAVGAVSTHGRCGTIRGAGLTVEEAHVVGGFLSMLITRKISPLSMVWCGIFDAG